MLEYILPINEPYEGMPLIEMPRSRRDLVKDVFGNDFILEGDWIKRSEFFGLKKTPVGVFGENALHVERKYLAEAESYAKLSHDVLGEPMRAVALGIVKASEEHND